MNRHIKIEGKAADKVRGLPSTIANGLKTWGCTRQHTADGSILISVPSNLKVTNGDELAQLLGVVL